MTDRLAGKVFMVTGAETGIGREITLRCLTEGASILAAGINVDALAELTELANQAGNSDRLATQEIDVRQIDTIQAASDKTVSHFGRMDGAIANAGIAQPKNSFIDIPIADWHNIIAINLTSVFATLQIAARVLINQGEGGSLLATGSSTAIKVMPGFAPYVATKGGVHAMLEVLALELAGHNIRVNTIVPGTTRTPLTTAMPGYIEGIEPGLPMKAVVEPEELAAFVAFALSDEAPHMTGTLLKVDSGRVLG
jgi:NAD(P)-dependent dehydrogenase (short-subunit alcohol dehydrogenase family)